MLILFFVTGLIFGSFISLLSYRLPREQNIFITRSKCPKCNHVLTVKNLFPVFSWLFFGGKCSYCKVQISIRYPLIEIAAAFLFSLVFLLFGVSILTALLLAIIILLVTITVIDFEHYIIPDSLQVTFFIIAIMWSYYFNYNVYSVLLNVVIGFASAFAIMAIFKYVRKKDGLGFGDVKFIAIATIFLGYQNLIILYLFSGIVGSINGVIWQYVLKQKIYPFAPSLCVAFFLCLIIPYFFASSWYMDINLLDMMIANFLL